MKGFVFTLDAIFSVVFAATAITLLVYVSYSSYLPQTIQTSQVNSAAAALISATVGSIGPLSPAFGASSQVAWPQYGANPGFSFGGPYGPTGPYLLYSYQASSNIIPVPVVGSGYVAFATSSKIYELNATTGRPAPNYPITTSNAVAGSPLIYKNMLIYADLGGYLNALSIYNGSQLWRSHSSMGYKAVTAPLEVEEGYITLAANTASGGKVYFVDPSNGTMVENDPTSASGGPTISWIAQYNGGYYAGVSPGKALNESLRHESVNASIYPSNSFASSGSFLIIGNGGTVALYRNTSAYYNKGSGRLNVTSVPYSTYPHRSSYRLPAALFNTTPSIGANLTYLLYNGIRFEAFGPSGLAFNSTLPNPPYWYNYSNIALAYGNAYVPDGNTLYVFGTGQQAGSNSSLLSLLSNLYLNKKGGLADSILYSAFGTVNPIGIYINQTYAPSLYVSSFNGINSYVSIPASPKLSPEAGSNGAMSLCGWYKVNNLAYNGLLFKGIQAPSSGSGAEYAVDPNGVRGFAVYTPSGNVVTSYSNTGTAISISNSIGAWDFFCFTYNSSASYYYLNGASYSASAPSGTAGTGTGSIVIGAGITSGTGSVAYSNVSAADIQLYSTSISSERVSSLYFAGMYAAPANASGLVGWWPLLGDGNDYSGNGFYGVGSVNYSRGPLPLYLTQSPEISRAGAPLQLNVNGTKRIYNVSVVIWSG